LIIRAVIPIFAIGVVMAGKRAVIPAAIIGVCVFSVIAFFPKERIREIIPAHAFLAGAGNAYLPRVGAALGSLFRRITVTAPLRGRLAIFFAVADISVIRTIAVILAPEHAEIVAAILAGRLA